jgi:hypothetical protein
MDEGRERKHLAQADQHIAKLNTRIAQQREMVARMIKAGHSSEVAESMLKTLEEGLRMMERHRRSILETLNKGAVTE